MFLSTCVSSLAYWEEFVQQMFGLLIFWQSLVFIHLQSVASSVERASGDSFTTDLVKVCVLSTMDNIYMAKFLKGPGKMQYCIVLKIPLG